MIPLAEKYQILEIFTFSQQFNFSPEHFQLVSDLKKELKTLIFGIGQIQKKHLAHQPINSTMQASISSTFKRDTLAKRVLLREEQPETTSVSFQTSLTASIKKLQKFERDLFWLIKEMLQTLEQAGQWAIFLSKNLLIKIFTYLQELVETRRCGDLYENIELFEKQNNLLEKVAFDKIYAQVQQNEIKTLNSFLKDFAQLFNYFLKRVLNGFKQVKILKNIFSPNLDDEEMFSQSNKAIVKKLKQVLIQFLEEKVVKSSRQIETCLSCEMKVTVQKMDAHLHLCRSKADIQEQILHLDGQIVAKIYDLNSELANAKNILRQKLREMNEKINMELEKQKKQKKGKKTFYGTPFLSKTFGNNVDSDSQSSRSLQSPRGALKDISDLSISELSTLISVIEQIQNIGGKIKNQRSAANLALSNEIYNMKNVVFKKFDKIRVKSPLVHTLLNLLSTRRECMRKLSKSLFQAKESGLKFVEDVYFQNEYEDIADSSNRSRKKNHKFLTPSERYFSEEETPSVSNDTENNHVCLKDFLILGYLGKGQFGQIFLVKKRQTGIKYAMKKVSMKDIKKNSENIQNQLVALSIVNSDFIVKTIFSFTENEFHYFVMEYLPNGDFFQLLESEGRMYESECKHYLAEIATGINDLHKEGIVHRDIKPQNILISKSGHIKISDFGLSEPGVVKKQKQEEKKKKMTEFVKQEIKKQEVQPDNTLTKIVGSPYFMSPEVLSGETASFISDWWSFGILIFEVLIGWPPFGGQSFDEIVQQVFEKKIWPDVIKFGTEDDMISFQAKDLIEQFLIEKPESRLGKNFEEIKNHPFFQGIDWNHLTAVTPHFQFEDQEENFGEGKEMSEKQSSFRSTNPDLKLIRKDILLEDTKLSHSRKLNQTLRLKKIIQNLRKESL